MAKALENSQSNIRATLLRSLGLVAIAALAVGVFVFVLGRHIVQPAAPATTVPVQVDVGKPIAVAGRDFNGVNFCALWNDTQDDPGTRRAFDAMHQQLMRFPGGVPAEWYDWQQPLASGWTQLSPGRAWNLARSGGASLIFQTNAATDSGGVNKQSEQAYRFDNSGKHAADWVRFAKASGMNVRFWEIGNEPEIDAPSGAKATQDSIYSWYDAKFEEQAKAIKLADPSAKVMGPASANTWYWWQQGNLDRFLAAEGNRKGSGLVDAVSLHWYPGTEDAPWDKKRDRAQDWEAAMTYIKAEIARYDTRPLPVYLTEWNFGGGMKNDSAATLGNALGTADCLGMFHRTGLAGETFFTLQHIKNGWGVLATRKDARPVDEPSPTYFALAMASHLLPIAVDANCTADPAKDLSVYATTDAKGHVAVMLINKTSLARTVPITFSGFTPNRLAEIYTLAGENGRIGDTDIVYNGNRWNGTPSGLMPPINKKISQTYTMPPYSMSVIVFSGAPRGN